MAETEPCLPTYPPVAKGATVNSNSQHYVTNDPTTTAPAAGDGESDGNDATAADEWAQLQI